MGKVCSRLRSRRGFTLAELLLVIAIMAVLGALGAAGVFHTQKSTEQRKLDRIAENLYSVAQNQLSQRALMYGGNTGAITPIAAEKLPTPVYAENEHNLYYVTNGSSLAARILPEGSVSADVREGSWIVEYEPESYRVYSVFYSDLPAERLLDEYYMVDQTNRDLRGDAETRSALSEGHIGYYSGELPEKVALRVGRLDVSLELENGEKLIARIRCASENATLYSQSKIEKMTVTVTGMTSRNTLRQDITPSIKTIGNGFTKEICLDSLETGLSFRSQFCEIGSFDWEREAGSELKPDLGLLYPGEQLQVTVTVETDGTLLDAEASGVVNSLFADASGVSGSDYIAYLACGRHLQNLDTATSGFDEEIFGASTVMAQQTADIEFGPDSDWRAAYGESRNFKPISNDAVREYLGNYCTIRYLTVDTDGDAGLFASFNGSSLTRILLEDPVIRGTGDVGGLAGTTAVAATVDSCRVYMARRISEEKNNGVTNAMLADWMKTTGEKKSAGGLVGYSADTLAIDNSLAATVVKGDNYAGGLVGYAKKNLTVTGSYADCYVGLAKSGSLTSSVYIGGLAGWCTSSSTFERCYSAGFVLEPSRYKKTAGFVPSDVSTIRNCYSVFCFDNPMKAVEGTVGGKKTWLPEAAPSNMTKYAFAASGSATNAYYTYSSVTNASRMRNITKISSDALAELEIEGFSRPPEEGAAANPYGLFGDERLKPLTTWDYPMLALPHYNDFYSVPEEPVNIVRVVLRNTAAEASLEPAQPETAAVDYTAVPKDGKIYVRSDSRLAIAQAFVGWFDEDAIADMEANPTAWVQEIDEGKIHKNYWWYIRDNARFSSVNGQDALDSVLPALPAQENEAVTLSEKAAESRRVYAVYREVQVYTVRIWYTRFSAERFSSSAPTADKYLNVGSIYQAIVYDVDPILERKYDSFNERGEHVFTLEDIPGYEIVSAGTLRESYSNLADPDAIAPFYGFGYDGKTYEPFPQTLMNGMSLDGNKLTVRIDRPCAYGVLYDAALVKFNAEFIFSNAAPGAGQYDGGNGLNDRAAAIASYFKGQDYDPDPTHQYTAYVAMAYPQNASVWRDLEPLRIEGFTLADKENTAVKTEVSGNTLVKKDTLRVWFTRNQHKLSFVLDGGLYYDGAEKKTVYTQTGDIYYNQPLTGFFPNVIDGTKIEANPDTKGIFRPNYTFSGWELYPLSLYGTEAGEQAKITVDRYGKLLTDGSSAKMQDCDMIAKAVWLPDKNAKLRLEIYVQDALDSVDKTAGGRSYALYNSFSIKTTTNVSSFCTFEEAYNGLASYDKLLKKVHDQTGVEVATPINADDERRYLNTDGTLRCPQLSIDYDAQDSSVHADGTVTYSFEESGEQTAIFKLFFKRSVITFNYWYLYENGDDPDLTFTGLYEAPLSHYTDASGKTCKWPGEGQYVWYAYAQIDETNSKLINDTEIAFLDTFYYDAWIKSAACQKATVLDFAGETKSGEFAVNFFIESIGNDRDQALRNAVNRGTGADDFADEMEQLIMAKKMDLFVTDADYTQKFSKDSLPPEWFSFEPGASTTRSFMPNDTYDGYTMGHFRTDLKDGRYTALGLICVWRFDEKIYKDGTTGELLFQSWEEIKKSKIESNSVHSDGGIRFNPKLEMYNSRKLYRVYFNNIQWGGESQFVDAYLYGAQIDRLPNITAGNEALYRPEGIGDDCHFVGWNTRSDGQGDWWTIGSGSAAHPFDDSNRSPYYGSEWLEGSVGVQNANGSVSNVTMPSNNLTVFAIWRSGEVTVNYYPMLTKSGDTVTGLTSSYGSSYRPASTKTSNGMRISDPLNAIRSDLRLSKYESYEDVLIIGDKYYRLLGWYQASDAEIRTGVDPQTLTRRFNEKDYVAVEGKTLNLVARWEQVGGPRGYTVECVLYENRGDMTPTRTLTLTNLQCGYKNEEAGKPLQVTAPTGENAQSESDPLYPLLQYSPDDSYQSVEKLDDEHSVFTFRYYRASLWDYDINYCMDVGGHKVIFEHIGPEHTYFAKRVVRPRENIRGYVLDGGNQSAGLERDGQTTAEFYYSLASNAIQLTGGTVAWDVASSPDVCPTLLTIGTESGTLKCLNSNYTIETTITFELGGRRDVVERRTSQSDGTERRELLWTPNLAGTYTAEVSIVLKQGGATIGTIFPTRTAARVEVSLGN